MSRRTDDRSDDPYQTTPRLPGEPAGNFELRRSISKLHERIEDGNTIRDEIHRKVIEIETNTGRAMQDLRDLDERTNDRDGHGFRLRKLETGAAVLALKIAAIMGGVLILVEAILKSWMRS
jgi:CHASE3 domain sensor protein